MNKINLIMTKSTDETRRGTQKRKHSYAIKNNYISEVDEHNGRLISANNCPMFSYVDRTAPILILFWICLISSHILY